MIIFRRNLVVGEYGERNECSIRLNKIEKLKTFNGIDFRNIDCSKNLSLNRKTPLNSAPTAHFVNSNEIIIVRAN